MDYSYVYILSNRKNGTLYVGKTVNLQKRIFEHKSKAIEGFTKKHDITKLVYFETHEDVLEAKKREVQMKAWKREWKINLIEKENPDWDDLYTHINT